MYRSRLPATLNSEFFTKDFEIIEFLGIQDCAFQAIDENAFKHLVNLKWIRLRDNDIKSLPYQIFKANPNLVYIDINSNKINSIDPDLFTNLRNLKFIESEGNQCINKNLGCETCSISQSDLDGGFSRCFARCLNDDDDCATKSGKAQILSQDKIDALISNGQTDVLLRNAFYQINYFRKNSENFQANYGAKLELQKNICKDLKDDVNKISGQFRNDLQTQQANFSKLNETIENLQGIVENVENTSNALSLNLEKTEGKVEKIVENLSLKFSEIKALMEIERLQWKLKEAEYINEKQAMELQMKNREAALKADLEKKFSEIVSEKIEALRNELKP